MAKLHVFMMAGLLVTYSHSSAQEFGGQIRGKVVNEQGSPLPGVNVQYTRVGEAKADPLGRITPVPPFVNDIVKTSTDGAFVVGGLPAGDYYICALPSSHGLIGSCEWNQAPVRISVFGQSGVPNVLLRVLTGVRIDFQVRDERGALASNPTLLIGVMSPTGYYRRADLQSASASARVYTVTAPKNQDLALFLHTSIALKTVDNRTILNGQRSIPLKTSGDEERVDLYIR